MLIRSDQEMIQDNMIVKHYAGSIAYGTNLPTSDVDIRGVFVADEIYYRSPWYSCGESSVKNEDTKFYELSKYMKLLVEQNPNIVETLWVHPSDVIMHTPVYDYLVTCRDELLSSKCAFTYSGYALSQLKRIKGHNKWINNPKPIQPPRQIDYISLVQDFSPDKYFKFTGDDMIAHNKDHRLVPYGNNIFGLYQMNGYTLFDDRFLLNTAYDEQAHPNEHPIRILKFNTEVYNHDKDDHSAYWEWKENRNEIRSQLEEQFGYDTKHAMHLMRLLRTGKEILTEGVVNVKRPDAAELLEIRHGKYTYEEILELANGLDDEIKQSYKTSGLRRSVDCKRASEIIVTLQDMVWR